MVLFIVLPCHVWSLGGKSAAFRGAWSIYKPACGRQYWQGWSGQCAPDPHATCSWWRSGNRIEAKSERSEIGCGVICFLLRSYAASIGNSVSTLPVQQTEIRGQFHALTCHLTYVILKAGSRNEGMSVLSRDRTWHLSVLSHDFTWHLSVLLLDPTWHLCTFKWSHLALECTFTWPHLALECTFTWPRLALECNFTWPHLARFTFYCGLTLWKFTSGWKCPWKSLAWRQCDFRLPPRYKWDLGYSIMLRYVTLRYVDR
jgi:hypothetical protein